MGEESWRIHNVGLSSLDLFKDNFFKSKNYLEKFKIDLSKTINITNPTLSNLAS